MLEVDMKILSGYIINWEIIEETITIIITVNIIQ